MTSTSPSRIECDSSADPNIRQGGNSGWFSRFSNALTVAPPMGVKGLQLNKMSFVNPLLQLNDACHLMFFYYRSSTAATAVQSGNLRCVRLHPSWFVPATGFTNFVKNRYFNTVAELVQALNVAASTGGDNVLWNSLWQANDVTFSYDATTRKLSFQGNTAGQFYTPAAADDPNVIAAIQTNPCSLNAWGAVIVQQSIAGQSMNARLGFAQAFANRGSNAGTPFLFGAAWSGGYPVANAVQMEADAYPMLFASQNINVYCAQVTGSGTDARGRRNLLATVPVLQPSLAVCTYDATGLRNPALQCGSHLDRLDFWFTDDFGNELRFPPNFAVQLEINILY